MSLTAEQIEIHATGIGASEISGVAGRNPWASPYDVWLTKPGPNRPAELEDEFETDEERSKKQVGSVVERSLIDIYRLRHPGDDVHHVSHVTERHPEHSWVIASPDGFVGRPDAIEALLELKVVGVHMAPFWEHGVPDFTLLQAQWQMFTFRQRFRRSIAPRVDVNRLLGTDYQEYAIEYDEPLVEALFDVGRAFWFEYVLTDTPPPVGRLENRSEYLAKRYPRPKLNVVPVPAELEDKVALLVERLRKVKLAYGKVKDVLETTECDLKEIIGQLDADGISGPWGQALWKLFRGQISYKNLAQSLCLHGVIPEALADKYRGASFRKFDLKNPKEK